MMHAWAVFCCLPPSYGTGKSEGTTQEHEKEEIIKYEGYITSKFPIPHQKMLEQTSESCCLRGDVDKHSPKMPALR